MRPSSITQLRFIIGVGPVRVKHSRLDCYRRDGRYRSPMCPLLRRLIIGAADVVAARRTAGAVPAGA